MSGNAVAGKRYIFLCLQIIVILLIVVYLVFIFSTGRTSNAEFSDVSKAVLDAADLSPMVEGDNQMIRRIYGLDPASFEGALLYYPSSNMGCEELLLIKLSDLSQQETVRQSMETRISSQRAAFDGYAPEQCEMLDQGLVEVRGNYLLLIVADDPDAVRNSFLDTI